MDELLQRFVVGGDGAAMEELVRRTRPALLRVARRIGAPQDADDAVQAAYLALVRRGALDTPVLPWLLTAVIRIAYRNKAVAKRRVAAAKRLSDWTQATPLDETIRRDEALALRREVTRLPADYRDALVLHYLEGLPIDDVAALLEVSPSAVKMRLLRGRALLRSRLGVRLGHSLLWLPWLVVDARASALGGLAMKTLGAAAAVAVVLGATYVAVRTHGHGETQARAESRETRTPVAEEPVPAATVPPIVAGAEEAFLSGRVVDEAGAPVAGAGVFVRQYDLDFPGRSVPFFYPYEAKPAGETDADGRFALQDGVLRLHSLWVVRRGYAAASWDFEEQPRRTGLELTAKTGFRALGTIWDTEGRPIGGARVILDGIAVHADTHGRYAFDILGPPPWRRFANAPGYESFNDPPGTKGGADGDIRLRRRSVVVEPVDAEAGASLADARGVVVRALSGAHAAVAVPKPAPSLPDVVYPPGRLYVDPMPDLTGGGRAEFDLHVFLPGYEPSVTRIVLAPGEEPPHLRIELARGEAEPVVQGRVEGAHVATVELREGDRPGMVWNEEFRPLLQTVTTDGGRFAIGGLPPGTYRMIVRAEGRGTVARDIGLPASDLVIRMQASATLVVLATEPEGGPAADAWIHVESADGAVFREERTDAQGRVTFRDLPAGGLLLCPARFGGSSARSRTIPLDEFEIDPGETCERRIEVAVKREFVLGVVDDKEEPVAGAAVALRPKAGYGMVLHDHPAYGPQARTNDRGEVTFSIYPGTYEATVVRDGAARIVVFDAGANRSHRIVLIAAPVLRGRVVDATNGAPVPNIQVAATAGNRPVGKATTDQEGRFAIGCPAEGAFRLDILARHVREGGMLIPTPFPMWVSRDIEAASVGAEEIRIPLPRIRGDGADIPVSVEVLATDASTGAPLDGARVGIGGLRDGFWMASDDQVTSGADGRATCKAMRADRYRLWISGPDGPIAYEVLKLERDGGPDEIRIAAPLERK